MAERRRASRGPRSGDHGAHWISYSDMMASLLLMFVLAVVLVLNELNQQQLRLQEQEGQLKIATITLAEREQELEKANVTLMGKQEELAAIQIQLDQQENDLHAAQSALKTKEEEQALLQLQLNEQADALAAMQTVLDSQKAEMLSYQQRIDAMIGVRTQIIQDLTRALTAANLGASVDAATGDIMLESTVFFDSGKDTIKEEGQRLLSQFVPVYLGVLLQPQYSDYIGEIVIEGHTDTKASYEYNLGLSQNRALTVAKYCLDLLPDNSPQENLFKELLTAKGRSFSDPIYMSDGVTVDQDASRRVEFKFRLKDDEMIQEMNRILSQMD